MKVKFKTTPEGEMALVPREEYERLKAIEQEAKEDAGVAALIARAKKEIAGGVPLIPKEVVDRLADGDNPIRVLRQFREQTQAELAAGVEITQNYLSDLETGKRKGPFELHQKIARCLGVPFDLLAPIAVSLAEADPARIAKHKQVIADKRRQRGQR
jgi:DNA-binding XRE family transcriptional regulator